MIKKVLLACLLISLMPLQAFATAGNYVEVECEHNFTDWYIVREATYELAGEECRDCKKCSHVEFRTVEAAVVTSGNVGKGTPYTDAVTYTLYTDGTMVIAGNGAVYCPDWLGDNQPYYDYRDQVKTLLIEEGITHTLGGCFAYFVNLESVSFPESLTKINNNAFMNSFVSSLKRITIPETVTHIASYTFGFYSGVKSAIFTDITIENPNVTFSASNTVFNSGKNLKNLTLYSYGAENNVRTYAETYGCRYVDLNECRKGEFGDIYYEVDSGVLRLDALAENASIPALDQPWASFRDKITKVVISKGVASIESNAFADYTALTEVEIPHTLQSVGDGAFAVTESNNTALTMALPRRMSSLGNNLFAGRNNVTLTVFYGSLGAEVDEPGVDLEVKKTFKLLLLGNSFSEDASNGSHTKTSQLLDILQAMLGSDAEITVGLIYSGGKGMHWHATQAEQGNSVYSFKTITTAEPTWKFLGSYTSADALAWTDWDAVSLQPYNINVSTGQESVFYPDATDPKFYHLEDSSAYMLDHVARYAPYAEVYFYMHWAQTSSTKLNAALGSYDKMAAFVLQTLDYVGTESGAQFKTIIPVGLSIQNARTTYLALLRHNTTAFADGNLNLMTDAQIGLQRDGDHVSFNVGRYIAALTFAETVIPEGMRSEGYVLPDIRITESVGKLPKEYSEIAQKSVLAAVNSWKNGSLAVTDISGYTEDPTVAAGKTLESMSFLLNCDTVEGLTEQLSAAVLTALPADFAVDHVSFDGARHTAAVTIRFGYTSLVVEVDYADGSHAYTAAVTAPTCVEPGYTTYTCVCGDSYMDNYVDATGHIYSHAYDAVCKECGDVRTVEVPLNFRGNSIHESASGLAFCFDVAVQGMEKNNFVAIYDNATVGGYKLLGMGAKATNGFETIDIPVVYLLDCDDSTASFAVRIIEIPAHAYSVPIAVTPYIVLDIDGAATTIYGDTQTCSYNDIKN